MKEKVCSISTTPLLEEKSGFEDKKYKQQYYLPDGTFIDIGSERVKAPELLFNPERAGLECQAVHELVINSISKTDVDLRKALYGEVYLSGGTTMINGFPDRLSGELRKHASKDVKV